MNAEPKRSPVPAIVGGIVGLMLGTAVVGGGATLASYVWVKKTENAVRKGWTLVVMMVASRDLAPGEIVDFDALSLKAVPEQFVTASVIKPDEASWVVNQQLQVPISSGTPLRFSFFSVDAGVRQWADAEIFDACSAEVKQRALASSERTGADIRERLGKAGEE